MGTNPRTSFAVTVLAMTALVAACSGGEAGPATSVSLQALVQSPEQWQGERVKVEGRLVRFTDPDGVSYGVIEDPEQHRIGLREIRPWERMVGQPVAAEGTVEFDSSFGWYLDQPRLTVASP